MPHHRRIGLVERRRAVERIKEWLETSERVLLVTGGAGTGKTTLILGIDSWWKPQWGLRIHATHYCQANRPFSADPVRVLASLAGQLARSLPGYAAVAGNLRLANDPFVSEDPVAAASNAVLDSPGPQAAYDRALHDPLEVLASTGRLLHDVLVVVDGLDEGAPEWTAPLTKLIISDGSRQTPRLRILVTARPGPVADYFCGTARFDLADDRQTATQDITEFLIRGTSLPKREPPGHRSGGGRLLSLRRSRHQIEPRRPVAARSARPAARGPARPLPTRVFRPARSHAVGPPGARPACPYEGRWPDHASGGRAAQRHGSRRGHRTYPMAGAVARHQTSAWGLGPRTLKEIIQDRYSFRYIGRVRSAILRKGRPPGIRSTSGGWSMRPSRSTAVASPIPRSCPEPFGA